MNPPVTGQPGVVLSIGQCAADHSRISNVMSRRWPVEVVGAADLESAVEWLNQESRNPESVRLILVNRILDADGESGLDVVDRLRSTPGTAEIPVMLVSNLDDAQQAAEARGALPGFGKAALEASETVQRIERVLNTGSQAQSGC